MFWRTHLCDQCPEFVACRTPDSRVVVATPCRPGGLLAIGEAPGAEEDTSGIGFVGDAGKYLRDLLRENGLSCIDYGVANICRCRPPGNRSPRAVEITSCLPYLASLIIGTKPKVILAVGGETAANVLCGPGTLHSKLAVRTTANDWSVETYRHLAHEGIRDALTGVSFLVPMPHTSRRVLIGNAPNGEGWASIAARQVALAVALLNQR